MPLPGTTEIYCDRPILGDTDIVTYHQRLILTTFYSLQCVHHELHAGAHVLFYDVEFCGKHFHRFSGFIKAAHKTTQEKVDIYGRSIQEENEHLCSTWSVHIIYVHVNLIVLVRILTCPSPLCVAPLAQYFKALKDASKLQALTAIGVSGLAPLKSRLHMHSSSSCSSGT